MYDPEDVDHTYSTDPQTRLIPISESKEANEFNEITSRATDGQDSLE